MRIHRLAVFAVGLLFLTAKPTLISSWSERIEEEEEKSWTHFLWKHNSANRKKPDSRNSLLNAFGFLLALALSLSLPLNRLSHSSHLVYFFSTPSRSDGDGREWQLQPISNGISPRPTTPAQRLLKADETAVLIAPRWNCSQIKLTGVAQRRRQRERKNVSVTLSSVAAGARGKQAAISPTLPFLISLRYFFLLQWKTWWNNWLFFRLFFFFFFHL